MIMAIMEALSRVLRPHDTVYTRALWTTDSVEEDQLQR
jgi:hypothetical protein